MFIKFLTFILTINICFSQTYKDIKVFSTVLNHVQSNYIEEKETSTLIYSAINGILRSLDPHTVYLDPERFQRFIAIDQGKLISIGVNLSIVGDHVIVSDVYENSPAEKIGLKSGDIIKKINNEILKTDISYPELSLLFNSEEDSEIELSVYRYENKQELNFKLSYEEITLSSIPLFVRLNDSTVYMKIEHFSNTTSDDFFSYMNKFENKSEKLIIDLRNNPGGRIESAIEIAEYFLTKGSVIAKTQGRKEDINHIYISTQDDAFQTPLILLVNNYSASASELLAGALQDNERAIVIGNNTFGKGLIQSTFLLDNGGAILMTIGEYLTPRGRKIQRDYKSISLEEYFSQIVLNDTTLNKNRPAYKSIEGKTTFVRGGITPDFSVFNYELDSIDYEQRTNALKIANFLLDNKELLSNANSFSNFLNNYFLSKEAYEFANNSLIKYSSTNALLVKAQIAKILWDKEAEFKILSEIDFQLKKAVTIDPSIITNN